MCGAEDEDAWPLTFGDLAPPCSARCSTRSPAACCGWRRFDGSRERDDRESSGRWDSVNKTRRPANSLKHSGWGNALLSWELLRVSRRTAALTIGRFAFGAALLGVMWLLYSARFAEQENYSGDITQLAKKLQRFAEEFSLTFFLVQLALVLLLTPIFVAGSVFEERETRSGEVLLTTDLTRREVFYGKFLARVVQVMLVVAAGMPVLALTLLWGGVAIEFIIAGYVATFLCILSSGAIAASVAGSAETLRQAVLKAYAYILVFDVLIFPASPFLLDRQHDEQ